MDIHFNIIFTFLLAIATTAIMMPWLLKLCYKRGLFDLPNERKIHKVNIPRLGGAVFIPCALVSFLIVLSTSGSDGFPALKTSSLAMGVGLMVVYVIGLLDDLFSLSASFRFIVQFLATTAFPICGLYLNNFYNIFGVGEVMPWLGYVITVFLCMVIINSMNMIDGIDGLCSSLSIIAFAVYLYFFCDCGNYIFALLCAAFIGTLIVYSAYNIFGRIEKKTKTFMGDSGSLSIGFALAYLGLKLSMENPTSMPPAEGIMIPFAVLFIPTIDLARVAITRMAKGRHPFSPDKTHIHHLLMQTGMSNHNTLLTLIIADIAVIATTLWLCNTGVSNTLIFCIYLAIYIAIITITKKNRKECQI